MEKITELSEKQINGLTQRVLDLKIPLINYPEAEPRGISG